MIRPVKYFLSAITYRSVFGGLRGPLPNLEWYPENGSRDTALDKRMLTGPFLNEDRSNLASAGDEVWGRLGRDECRADGLCCSC